MQVPAAMARDLALLSESLDGPPTGLASRVEALSDMARSAVDSYLGLTLSLSGPAGDVRMSSIPAASGIDASAGSSIRLPVGDPTVDIILYAARPGAFVDLSADLAWLTGTDLGEIQIDAHLVPSAAAAVSARSVALQAAVDQAFGALIGGGATPEEATATLAVLATLAEHEQWVAVLAVFEGTFDP